MEIFLRAKHWQIFLLMVGLPIVLGAVFAISIMSELVQSENPDPTIIFRYFYFIPIITLLPMATKLGWQWAVAIRLQRLAPQVVFKNTSFKIFTFCIIACYAVVFVFIFSFFKSIPAMAAAGENAGPPPEFFIGFVIIFPLSLFNTFCTFYCYYSVAKTFKTVEMQRQVGFSDFVLECVLIWFFFIGVWILQPKINKMVEQESMPQEVPPAA